VLLRWKIPEPILIACAAVQALCCGRRELLAWLFFF